MNHCTKEQLIAFERRIADQWESGELPYLLHFSGGNEDHLIEIFSGIRPGDWIFSGHRSHYHYLLAGGDPARLEQMIQTGRSMFVFGVGPMPSSGGGPSRGAPGRGTGPTSDPDLECHFVTSSVLAGLCCVAAGVAWDIQHSSFNLQPSPRVWCFLGDGAEDEGHFYEAVQFVDGHDLPCTFIIEDNDRSVDTSRGQRRGNPHAIYWPDCVRRYKYKATFPHAGSGCKHHIVFKSLIPKSA